MEEPMLLASVIYAPSNKTCYTYITLVISSFGVALSLCAFFLLILTAVLFAEWRQNQKNQLLVQFMLARIMYMLIRYLVDIEKVVNYCDPRCVIKLDMLVLTYTECALVAWMCRFSKHMNDSLVKVFSVNEYNMWELSLSTWTIPGIISCIIYIIISLNKYESWLVFSIYFSLLKWPVLSVNAYLLITALKAVLITNKSHTENNTRIIVVMIVLIFVFSFQELFLDITRMIHVFVLTAHQNAYMTTVNILAVYQCALSIFFWVFGNSKTRELWRFGRKTKSKETTPSHLNIRISISSESVQI